jgi:isocitrate/isopropylmalate dehydrogenase
VPIDNPTRHAFQQFRMRNAVEVAAQIRVYHLRVAGVQQAVDRSNRVVCPAIMSVGVLLWRQVRSEDRLKHHTHRRLDHPFGVLTLVTKSNAQRFGMVMWDEIFFEVARDYPDVRTDRELVDAVTTRMVLKPKSLDVVVATNLHADILSDLAAALSGSLGIGATANLNPERQFPSMFEPIHGSAFDITGKGIANPIATFWTASMMLEHLGEAAAARRLMQAIEATTAAGVHTPDLGGNATTRDVTDAVCGALRS